MVIASLIQTLEHHGRLTSEKAARPVNISHHNCLLREARNMAMGMVEISQSPFLDLDAVDPNGLPLKFPNARKRQFI